MSSVFQNVKLGTINREGWFESGQPYVQRLDEKMFRLTRPYTVKWESTGPNDVGYMTVPRGFVCDLSSIPRSFWALVPKSGLHDGPSVIHDYCYDILWQDNRGYSDALFYDAMIVVGVPKLRAKVMYWAVDHFGWQIWNARRVARLADSANDDG